MDYRERGFLPYKGLSPAHIHPNRAVIRVRLRRYRLVLYSYKWSLQVVCPQQRSLHYHASVHTSLAVVIVQLLTIEYHIQWKHSAKYNATSVFMFFVSQINEDWNLLLAHPCGLKPTNYVHWQVITWPLCCSPYRSIPWRRQNMKVVNFPPANINRHAGADTLNAEHGKNVVAF